MSKRRAIERRAMLNTEICLAKWYLTKGSMTERCKAVVSLMSMRSSAFWFKMPVPIDLVPDYLEVIQNPMDYSAVLTRLNRGYYKSMDAFASDMRLIFHNAMEYNWSPQHDCHIAGKTELKAFEAHFAVASRSRGDGRRRWDDHTRAQYMSAASSLLMMSFGY